MSSPRTHTLSMTVKQHQCSSAVTALGEKNKNTHTKKTNQIWMTAWKTLNSRLREELKAILKITADEIVTTYIT